MKFDIQTISANVFKAHKLHIQDYQNTLKKSVLSFDLRHFDIYQFSTH